MAVKELVRKEFRHLRWIIITGVLVNCTTALLIVGAYYFLKKFVGQIPAETLLMLQEIDIIHSVLSIFSDYSHYIWSQWNAKNLFQVAAFLVIIIAATQYAGEAGKKTMTFLLSRPVNRRQVLTAKCLAVFLALLLFFTTGTVVLLISSRLFGYRLLNSMIVTAGFLTLLWVYVYYLVGSIVSLFFSEPLPAGVAIGLTGLLLSVPGLFGGLRPYSIFYQMKATGYFLFAESPFGSIIAALVLTGILYFAALRVFQTRDY